MCARMCVCVCVYGLQHCILYEYIQIAALPINSHETTGQHLISLSDLVGDLYHKWDFHLTDLPLLLWVRFTVYSYVDFI